MLQTKSAGGVVLNSEGKILVVSQHGTSWSLPKGHVEEGEDLMTAAKRELYEETGIREVEYVGELGTYQRFKIGEHGNEDRGELKTITMFLFRTKEENLQPVDPENPTAKWVEREKVAELLTHPKDKEFFLSVIDKIESEVREHNEGSRK